MRLTFNGEFITHLVVLLGRLLILAVTASFVSAGLSVAAPSPTPTPTPQTIYNRPVAHLASDRLRSRVYATVPDDNTVIVVDTSSLTVTRAIAIGSAPQGLTMSADGSKLWVAVSGSTNFAIGVIDLNTLQPLPSLPAPKQPYDIEEGAGHRLFLTPLAQLIPNGGIMQVDGDTGQFQRYLGGFEIYKAGFLEISPDRNSLFFGNIGLSVGTMDKFDVSTINSSLVQQVGFSGGDGIGLRVNHSGQFVVYPNKQGNGSPAYTTFKIPTADITSVNGSFNVGSYPGPAVFSNDDMILYHSAFNAGRIVIFDTTTLASLGTITLSGNPSPSDVAVDKSGRWLFIATLDPFQGNGDLRVVDTGRNDPLPTPTPVGTPTPTPTPTPIPTSTPTPTVTPSPTALPQVIFDHAVAALAVDPIRSRIYGTAPTDNAVIVIDTSSMVLTETIPIGLAPQGLAVSADGSKLWIANSGSTESAIGVIDLKTLQVLPSLPAPHKPYAIVEGTGHRLFLTPFDAIPNGGVMQIDADTGLFQEYLGGFEVYSKGFLEISPDRHRLFYGNAGVSSSTMDKFNVSTVNGSLVQQASFEGSGSGLSVSHNGQLVVYPNGAGNGKPIYSTFEIPTANIATINGTFVVGDFAGPAVFSNDSTLLYHSVSSSNHRIEIFDTGTFLLLDFISLSGTTSVSDLAIDRSGRWLFVSTADFQGGGDLRVFDTGRYDPLETPTPGGTATPSTTSTPTATPTPTPIESATPSPTPTLTPSGSVLANISTRLGVETGNNALIGGFIVTGTQQKRVIVRAIGPSLFVAGPLANPKLELHDSSGGLIAADDDWRTGGQEAEIMATGIAPPNDLESAIVATLPAGSSAYTAIVSGVDNGTGVGLVEVYDLDLTVDSKLANISTRGFVQTDDNVLIGGLIVVGKNSMRVIVRAIGPSLPVSGALANPTLELHDGSGALIASNDDWRSDQEPQIIATGLAPTNDLESAIVRDLAPGNYTAIVRGVNNSTGVGLVEVYGLN